MSRIADAQPRAKPQTIPCCICRQKHPEDRQTRRMREHDHQGRRCLGADIPFARHTEPTMGKLVGVICSRVPMPNRARALQLADGYFDQATIARVMSESVERDHHPLWWIERMMMCRLQAQLDAGAPPRRKLGVARERRVGA